MDSQSSTALPMEPPPAVPLGGAEDLISGLPDELLHIILTRLPCSAAAARTSVLSRRWRGVWAHMPELVLLVSPAPAAPPSALLDSVDAALDSSAAPTLRSLKINVSGFDRCDVPAHRISPWLRFASQRCAGILRLHLSLMNDLMNLSSDKATEITLPICERATEIDLDIMTCNVFLRPPPTGSFSLLSDLKISCAQMNGGELGRVVSSPQCPHLRKLRIFVLNLKPVRDISISSESLRCLHLASYTSKLEVTAPMLQEISVTSAPDACIVVSPKLEKVAWLHTYDPCRHQFVVAGCRLQSLSIMQSNTSSTRLMERFNTTSELKVYLGLLKWQGIAGYMTFLKEMEKLPICETLVVYVMTNHHAFAPMVLHLLRRCSCIRKFKLTLYGFAPSEMPSYTTSDCPFLLPENYRLDDITSDSLEEIAVGFFTGSAEQEAFVELLLSRCNAMTLKRVDFIVPFAVSSEIMEVVQRIHSMCHSNSKVEFNVHPMGLEP